MLRYTKYAILAFVIVLAGMQLIRPAKTNPPIRSNHEIHASLALDSDVARVLSRSCNDCHSNRTTWPWYSSVAPVSWLVISDVNRGRAALNFSEWGAYRADKQREHLSEICKEVSEGEMPGFSYTLMHRDTKLSKAEVAAVCRWTQTTAQTLLTNGHLRQAFDE